MKSSEYINVKKGYDLAFLRNENSPISLFLKNISDKKHIRILHFLSLILILFFRRPDALLNAQPWAEDGQVFLQQAIEHSFHSLFILYAGYLHTIPRLVTLISLQFSFTNAPLIMNSFALLISTLSISYFFNEDFRFIIRNDFLRLLCTVVMICLPFSEIYLNITNIHWFLSFFIALWGVKFIFNFNSLAEKDINYSLKEIFCIFFLSLSFLTAPLSFIMIPFLIASYLYRIKSKAFSHLDMILYSIPIIFALVHLIICTSSKTSIPLKFPSFFLIVRLFSLQIVPKLFCNDLGKFGIHFEFLPISILTIFSTLFLSVLLITILRKKQLFVDFFLLLIIFMSIFYLILTRANDLYAPEVIMNTPRYMFFPLTFFLIFIVRQIDTFDKKSKFYVFLLIMLALILVNVTLNYNLKPFDDYNFKQYSKYYDPNGQFLCNIPINPCSGGLSFSMNFPCNQTLIILFPGTEQNPKETSFENIPIHRPTFTTQMPVSLYSFFSKTISGVNKICMYQHAVNNNFITFSNIKIPEKSKLSLSIALDPKVWDLSKGDGVLFEVYANNNDPANKIFSHYIDPKNNISERKWNDFEIDLSKFSNEQVTLIFSTQPGPKNDGKYDWAWWGDAIIYRK